MMQICIFSSFSAIKLILLYNKFRRNIKSRKQYIACELVRLNFIYNFLNIGNGFRQIFKQGFHLPVTLEIIFGIGKAIAISTAMANWSGLLLPILNAQ